MVCPQDIRDAIANTPPGDTLTLEINSGGGSLYAGFEMYSLLVAAEVPTAPRCRALPGRRHPFCWQVCRTAAAHRSDR